MKRLTRLPVAWPAVPAILLFFWLAMSSLVGDSPTMDEQNHLARGLAFLETGDPRLSLEHPPLVNSLSALPVHLLLDVRLPTDHPSWERPGGWYEFAELLLWEYNHDVTRMIFLARLPILFLTLALALVGYHFARAAAGNRRPAAFYLLFGFCPLLFDPNLLAHGRYTTTDLGGTLFIFLAAFFLWRLWVGRPAPGAGVGWGDSGRRSRAGRLALAALALGLAFGSKLSTLAFAPIFLLLALLPLYERPWSWRAGGRRIAQLAAAGGASLLVVWAIFGLQWDAFQFQHDALRSLNRFSGPMPTFWAGIEQILLLSGGGRPTFLLGRTSVEGFLAYFPVAFLVKTPLATLFLFLLTLWLLAQRRVARRAALFLLLPALLYFALSMTSDLNIGYRHLLPALPFLYIAAAVVITAPPHARLPGSGRLVPGRAGHAAARQTAPLHLVIGLFLLAALLMETVHVHPHYLSFFNAAAGGPEDGYRLLVDSNVDWGQDLLRLREWMASNEVETVKLSWFGTADPDYYGIPYDPLPGLPYHFNLWWDLPFDPVAPPPGVYAISASNLWELPLQEEKYTFPWFRARRPDDRVGYSILIYRVGS